MGYNPEKDWSKTPWALRKALQDLGFFTPFLSVAPFFLFLGGHVPLQPFTSAAVWLWGSSG